MFQPEPVGSKTDSLELLLFWVSLGEWLKNIKVLILDQDFLHSISQQNWVDSPSDPGIQGNQDLPAETNIMSINQDVLTRFCRTSVWTLPLHPWVQLVQNRPCRPDPETQLSHWQEPKNQNMLTHQNPTISYRCSSGPLWSWGTQVTWISRLALKQELQFGSEAIKQQNNQPNNHHLIYKSSVLLIIIIIKHHLYLDTSCL